MHLNNKQRQNSWNTTALYITKPTEWFDIEASALQWNQSSSHQQSHCDTVVKEKRIMAQNHLFQRNLIHLTTLTSISFESIHFDGTFQVFLRRVLHLLRDS